MKNVKYYPLLLALACACGNPDQTSEPKTITNGRVTGNFSSWITTSSSTKFEDSRTWALEGGMTYFPEVAWSPTADILWTYDSSAIHATRGEIKAKELQKDTGPSAILLADWFRYLPIESFPSPLWSTSAAGNISSGFFLIDNVNYLDESRDLLDEIYFKTFVRMKGENSTGIVSTKIIAVCSGQEPVAHGNETILMPKPIFTEIVHESDLRPQTLKLNDWTYFKADVIVREGVYQPMADRCRPAEGELVAYLDIQVSKTGAGSATTQFITTEMITVGGDE
ncbi:hypothetical protein [Oligoflexus tunisiensis]|uniref:hypothetical protein n=1 Tax=Oligoflexus tunisiensis TaxID=708132 RepID=UPI00114CA566|nr:hypothetical protein [Oligoflexus tunisiensis]